MVLFYLSAFLWGITFVVCFTFWQLDKNKKLLWYILACCAFFIWDIVSYIQSSINDGEGDFTIQAILSIAFYAWCLFDCFKGRGSSKIKSGKSSDGKSNEITTGYYDEVVLKYFSNELKSGCFGGKPKYSDKDYDNILLRWLNANATKEFALHKLGVDESQVNEIEPICFQGFESENAFVGRYGLDGKFRTSQYSVTWLFFSDSQIFVFNIFYDLLYHKTKIITYEYFYKDITNFSSIFSSYEYEKLIEKKGCMSKGFDKELKKIETQKFSIVVPGDSFSCSVSGVAKIDGIIQGLKQKLREKKEQRG